MFVKFDLNSKPNKDGKYQIYAFVRESDSRILIRSKIAVAFEQWNKEKRSIKKSKDKSSRESNNALIALENEINKKYKQILTEFPIQQANERLAMLKKMFVEKTEIKEKPKTIFEIYDKFLVYQKDKRKNKATTMLKYEAFRNKLVGFSKTKRNLKISDFLEMETQLHFDQYLTKIGNNRNTQARALKMLKTFINFAHKGKYINFNSKASELSDYATEAKPRDIIVLDKYELAQMESVILPKHLDAIRDCFLFCCYTGQRYQDCRNFRFNDIREIYSNSFAWQLETQKTDHKLSIPLIDEAINLIEKYKAIGETKLPFISNQKANASIKKIAQLAGINDEVTTWKYEGNEKIKYSIPKYRLITFHTGRRTYITTSISLGIDVPTVMQQSGHSRYETMKPYIELANEKTQKQITGKWRKPKLSLVNTSNH